MRQIFSFFYCLIKRINIEWFLNLHLEEIHMRILQCINALTYGGAQTLLIDLCLRGYSEGHEIKVVSFKDGPIGNRLRKANIEVEILGENMLDVPAFFKLRKIIKQFSPNIIHTHLFKATLLARLANNDAKASFVTSIHGAENSFFHFFERRFQSKSDHLIFPSNFLQNWYAENVSPNLSCNSSVIYPGVNIFQKQVKERCSNKKITIGTLSRLHPVKGIDRLLKACKTLNDEGYEFEILIGGDGKIKPELIKLSETLEISHLCTFEGEIENPREFLKKIDIFVAPSRQESFGIHVCEAMESSLPVIAANIGGLPEIISDHAGLLFEPDSENGLKIQLSTLIDNYETRVSMGEKARQMVESKFNRKMAIDKHFELFKNLSDEKRKKIHFAISSNELGGGERLALSLMEELKTRGWEISATCAGAPLQQEINKLSNQCSAISMKAGGIFYALKLFTDLKKIRPSIVSSHLNKASLISGLYSSYLGIPSVAHVHGLNRLSYYKNCTHLIPVSTAVEKHLKIQDIKNKKITTLPNCINKEIAPSNARHQEPFKISIVAKLHANKGHYWALKALRKHYKELPDFEIKIFGDGPERENLEREFLKDEFSTRIKFYGFVNNIEDFYKETDLVFLPSLGEGIPLSLLEAMRFGIPCLATKVGGIPEIVIHNYNGLLISPRNDSQLIEALKTLLNKENILKFGANSVDFFKKHNDFKAMVSKFETILMDSIEN